MRGSPKSSKTARGLDFVQGEQRTTLTAAAYAHYLQLTHVLLSYLINSKQRVTR